MTEMQRRIDDQSDRDRRSFVQSRGLVVMNRRRKIKMCAYGSCRVEFYAYGEKGCGKTLYCLPCRKIVRLASSARWRKRNRTIINKKNNEWWVKAGGAKKQHEYYLKRKAAKLEAVTHG